MVSNPHLSVVVFSHQATSAQMPEIPEPHPLDFDWRFDDCTTTEICDLFPKDRPVLAIGAPSVARRLESIGQQVLLVDRQPLQGVKNHLAVEVGQALPRISGYCVSILDPPWYVSDVQNWTSWAAHLVGVRGEVIVSLWPDSTRPTAPDENRYLSEWFSSWASIDELSIIPRYACPIFENRSQILSSITQVEHSPRFGRLIRLSVQTLPNKPAVGQKTERWLRFVLNNYQLALRLHESIREGPPQKVPGAIDWQWPHVSRRAANREKIDLWSSHNEVAIIGDSSKLAADLRTAIESSSDELFQRILDNYPDLRSWDVPRPPYWRKLEWHHPQ